MQSTTLQEIMPVLAAVLAGAALIGIVIWFWRGRRGRLTLERVTRDIALEWERDLIIPDGAGGETQLDHLIMTAHGILVLDVKSVSGNVFCSERMEEWTVIDGDRRYTFKNPLGTVYDKVAAVRRHIQEIPVQGFIVFTSQADFTKGRPENVVNLEELRDRFIAKGPTDQLMEAFRPHWDRLVEQGHPAA